MNQAIEISLIIIFCLVIFVFLFSCVIYFIIFYGSQKGTKREMEPLKGKLYEQFYEKSKSLISLSNNIPFEKVELKIKKRFILRAKLYFTNNQCPLAIMVHGYKGCGIRDFSGGVNEMINRGFNVLLLDHRGHGMSDGRTISFGIKEKDDVLKWIDFANQRFNYPDIYLYGISMGAATVLMVSGLNLPNNVKRIVADCPYSSVKEEILWTVKKMHAPTIVYPFIYLAAIIFGGFNLENGEVKNYLKNANIPILIIHGTIDDIVPIDMSRKLYELYPNKIQLIEVKNAPHGMSYFVDYELYGRSLDQFINL